jgi:hypothetical protein
MARSVSVLSIRREGLLLKITVEKRIIHGECVYAVQAERKKRKRDVKGCVHLLGALLQIALKLYPFFASSLTRSHLIITSLLASSCCWTDKNREEECRDTHTHLCDRGQTTAMGHGDHSPAGTFHLTEEAIESTTVTNNRWTSKEWQLDPFTLTKGACIR